MFEIGVIRRVYSSFLELSFNFVDRGKGFLLNIKKAELKLAGKPFSWGEFQIYWKGYPLILTRQLTSQATKGRDEARGSPPGFFYGIESIRKPIQFHS